MQAPSSLIHPTAIIAAGALIGEGTSIGAYTIVGPKVTLGKNNIVGPHVVIEGNTTIGDNNKIYQFASVGSAPQDLKYKGEDSKLIVGHKNTVREFVTMQPGTQGGGMVTTVGDNNLFMVSSHLGHDGTVGNNNVIANCCALAGHITIGNHTILGGLSAVHQFVRVGDYAMVGGGAMVTLDVIPGGQAQGDRAALAGINSIGLERAGFNEDEVREVKNLYRLLFVSKDKSFADRLSQAKEKFQTNFAQKICSFIESSSRGICYSRSRRHE